MRNCFEKYKNPDGSKKNRTDEVNRITLRFGQKLGLQFGSFGRGSNVIKSKKPKMRMRKFSRTMNRSNK